MDYLKGYISERSRLPGIHCLEEGHTWVIIKEDGSKSYWTFIFDGDISPFTFWYELRDEKILIWAKPESRREILNYVILCIRLKLASETPLIRSLNKHRA